MFPATTRTFTKDTALSGQGRDAAWRVWINARHGRGTAWARHGHGMLCVNPPLGVGLRPLACWDCGFKYCRRHGCLSVVSVVCCQVEVSATGWSLVQMSPVVRRCAWSRNIKNIRSIYIYIYIYIYDIRSLKVNDLTLILLTWRKWWANNASN